MAKRATDEWDELYAAPLDQFIARRKELGAALEKAGEAARAQALSKARRPAVSAWAVNQAIRAQPDAAAELFDAGDALRRAQHALLTGGDADAFRQASERLRAVVRTLTQAAAKIATEAGHADTAALLGKAERTLFTGATSDGAAREQLQRGVLATDLTPEDALTHGFPPPGGAPPAQAAAPAAAPKAPKKEDGKAQKEAEARARKEHAELEKEAERLEVEAKELEKEAHAAERKAEALEKKARAAEVEAKEASERAQAARWDAGQSRTDAEAAQLRARESLLKASAARARASAGETR